MDFYYFQFNFIKNQNKSEFLMYNLSIIICLLNFQYRVKWKLMACLDMIEKDNYPYSLLYGRLKRKTFVATKIHYLSCFISSTVLFPSSNHLRKRFAVPQSQLNMFVIELMLSNVIVTIYFNIFSPT